jgi:choline-glycine betaine transporter
MIGQFVSRFAGGIKTGHLLLALLIVPSIPIAVWFSVLYFYFSQGVEIGSGWRIAMVVVGIIFVINSLDSLIRLYTQNLQITPEKMGKARYVAANWGTLVVLVLLYQFTPLKIEWIGLVVVALYVAIYVMVYQRRALLSGRG